MTCSVTLASRHIESGRFRCLAKVPVEMLKGGIKYDVNLGSDGALHGVPFDSLEVCNDC